MKRADWQHLYHGKNRLRMRAVQLRHEPLCAYCLREGRYTAATVADHVIPHKGDRGLFFDPRNLQSLCKHCHDSTKAKQENATGCDVYGNPLDPAHHWNK